MEFACRGRLTGVLLERGGPIAHVRRSQEWLHLSGRKTKNCEQGALCSEPACGRMHEGPVQGALPFESGGDTNITETWVGCVEGCCDQQSIIHIKGEGAWGKPHHAPPYRREELGQGLRVWSGEHPVRQSPEGDEDSLRGGWSRVHGYMLPLIAVLEEGLREAGQPSGPSMAGREMKRGFLTPVTSLSQLSFAMVALDDDTMDLVHLEGPQGRKALPPPQRRQSVDPIPKQDTPCSSRRPATGARMTLSAL